MKITEKTRLGLIISDLSKVQLIICSVMSAALIVVALFMFTPAHNPKTYNVDFSAIDHIEEDGSEKLLTHGISLPKGHYDITIGYMSPVDAEINISLGNTALRNEVISATGEEGTVRQYSFDLIEGTDRGKIEIAYPEGTEFALAFMTISSDRMIYNDGIIWAIFLIAMIPCVWMSFWFYNRSTHKMSLIITILVVAVQMIPFMMQQGINIGVDSQTHMMRIEGIYYGILDGQFPSVLYPEWNNSYGQIGALYPNVFLYIPAVFRLLGMSQLGVCKLFIYLVIIVSALIALGCARTIFKRDWQINMCVIALTLEDIRLWDMLHRGRVQGSLLAEMFLPLVVAGLIEILYQNRKKWYLLAYGMAGITCCHLTTLTVTIIAVAIVVLISYKRIIDRKAYREIAYALILYAGLTVGTIVCFLGLYSRDYSGGLVWRDFMEMLWSIKGIPDSHKWISVLVKVILCYIAVITAIVHKRTQSFRGGFAIPMLICATALAWMSTALFPWTILRRISVVKYYTDMLQSGDRFLNVAAVLLSFCIPALVMSTVPNEKSDRLNRSNASRTAIFTYCVILIVSLYNLTINEYTFFVTDTDKMYYDGVIGDIEVDSDDYLPEGTQVEWYRTDTGYISDEEAVQSLSYERCLSHIDYGYTNSRKGAYVEFPKFYYKGYKATDENGEEMEVTKGDRNRIRVVLKTTDTPAW